MNLINDSETDACSETNECLGVRLMNRLVVVYKITPSKSTLLSTTATRSQINTYARSHITV